MSALNHFDRIHSNPGFQSLMQQEMVRLHRGEENALSSLVEKVFRPLMEQMQQVARRGNCIRGADSVPIQRRCATPRWAPMSSTFSPRR